MNNYGEIIIYQTEDGLTKINVNMQDETVWLSLGQMAEVFQRDKSTISRHKDEIQPYFDAVKRLQKSRREINVEGLNAEKVGELLDAVEGMLLEEAEGQNVRDVYQNILTVLGYKFENETVQQTYEKVKNLITTSYEISNFS